MPGKLKLKSKRKKLDGKERKQKQSNESFPDEEIGKDIEDEMPSAEKYFSDSMHAHADMQVNLFHLKNTLSMVESIYCVDITSTTCSSHISLFCFHLEILTHFYIHYSYFRLGILKPESYKSTLNIKPK